MEVVVKVVVLEVLQCFLWVGETFRMGVYMICLIGEVVCLVLGVKLLLNGDFRAGCQVYEPHYTFVQFFVALYSVILVGVIFYLADTACSKNEITVLDSIYKRNGGHYDGINHNYYNGNSLY